MGKDKSNNWRAGDPGSTMLTPPNLPLNKGRQGGVRDSSLEVIHE
jgi:hypothetical protein